MSGPTVSVHTPSAALSNGIGVFPFPTARRIGPPVNATVRASGALIRNVTVRSSRTSGEMTFAPYGFRFWTFLCGFQSRLTCACWASAGCDAQRTAATTAQVFIMFISMHELATARSDSRPRSRQSPRRRKLARFICACKAEDRETFQTKEPGTLRASERARAAQINATAQRNIEYRASSTGTKRDTTNMSIHACTVIVESVDLWR